MHVFRALGRENPPWSAKYVHLFYPACMFLNGGRISGMNREMCILEYYKVCTNCAYFMSVTLFWYLWNSCDRHKQYSYVMRLTQFPNPEKTFKFDKLNFLST